MIPYLAVTSHWIQSVKVQHVSGPPTEELVLRADLIGFHHLPGHHTGRHMAHLFLFVLDCISIATKVQFLNAVLIGLLIHTTSGWLGDNG
jgi:hypothetical protein